MKNEKKGWNWVKTKFNSSSLEFYHEKKRAFFIPFDDIERTTINKDEVTLAFHDSANKNVRSNNLVEIKLCIPSTTKELVFFLFFIFYFLFFIFYFLFYFLFFIFIFIFYFLFLFLFFIFYFLFFIFIFIFYFFLSLIFYFYFIFFIFFYT